MSTIKTLLLSHMSNEINITFNLSITKIVFGKLSDRNFISKFRGQTNYYKFYGSRTS